MTKTLESLQAEADALQAEVARLREDRDYCARKADEETRANEATKAEIARLRDDLRLMSSSFIQASDELDTERAAHEATKAELAARSRRCDTWAAELDATKAAVAWMKRAESSEARVAELELQNTSLHQQADQLGAWVADGRAALAQARALLERLNTWNETEGTTEDIVLLCADNAAWLRAHPAIAAPAATGAESEKPAARVIDLFEALKQALQKAQKEQGT